MIKKNCKKTLALAAAGLSIFEAGAICGNVLEITNAAAYERQVTMDKVSIIGQGTEVGKNLTANVTDINGTTSAAVTVVLNEEIFVDNIVSNYDENQKVESIRAGLEEIKTINVNLKINGLEINTDIEVLQGNTIYTCGWLIKQDREDEEDWETDNIIYVKLRTNKLKFNKDGIEYEIPNFEYNTVVDVSPQNTGNNTAVELKSVNINGTLKVGETLSATVIDVNDNLVNSDVAYRWYRYDKLESGLGIEVGKESTYKLQKDDKGKYIKLVVTNDNNSVEVMSGKINAESSSSSTGGSSSSGGSSSTDGSNSSGGSSSSGGSNSSGGSSSSGESSSTDGSSSSTNNTATNNNIPTNTIVSAGSTAAVKTDEKGTVHLIDESGNAATGWQRVGTFWYFGEESGQAATGWRKVEDKWYLMNDNGVMTTGWQKVDGTWYFMKDSGAMTTGWQKVDGTWYYMKDNGAMTTGWQKVNGTWYYMENSGAMKTGWLNDNGTWYYLNADGSMASNTYVDGYYLGSNGAWIR